MAAGVFRHQVQQTTPSGLFPGTSRKWQWACVWRLGLISIAEEPEGWERDWAEQHEQGIAA